MSLKTLQLLYELKAHGVTLVLVTGARTLTLRERLFVLTWCDYFILENGALIADSLIVRDEEWHQRMMRHHKHLVDWQNTLKSKGWVLDDDGRAYASRVRLEDNPRKTREQFEALVEQCPKNVVVTRNLGHIDFLVKGSGKERAVEYFLEQRMHGEVHSAAFGDDVNDIGMLSKVDDAYVIRGAYQEAIDTARERGWYLTKNKHFAGIHEALREYLVNLEH
jgi:hydroxymethylpyrimidine pyrophosphatase-like HAD family hydrolase